MCTLEAGSEPARLRPPAGSTTSGAASLALPPAWARRVGRSCQAAKSQLRRPCASTRSSITGSLDAHPPRGDALRQQRPHRQLDLQPARRQQGRAAHVGRRRQRDLGEGNAEPREVGELGRPGDHQVATGACLDQLDGPVANEIDRRGDQQERHGAGQDTAEAERRIAYGRQPSRLPAARLCARHPHGDRTAVCVDRPDWRGLAHASVALCRQCGIGHRVEVGARNLCEALLMSMAEAGWAQPCSQIMSWAGQGKIGHAAVFHASFAGAPRRPGLHA